MPLQEWSGPQGPSPLQLRSRPEPSPPLSEKDPSVLRSTCGPRCGGTTSPTSAKTTKKLGSAALETAANSSTTARTTNTAGRLNGNWMKAGTESMMRKTMRLAAMRRICLSNASSAEVPSRTPWSPSVGTTSVRAVPSNTTANPSAATSVTSKPMASSTQQKNSWQNWKNTKGRKKRRKSSSIQTMERIHNSRAPCFQFHTVLSTADCQERHTGRWKPLKQKGTTKEMKAGGSDKQRYGAMTAGETLSNMCFPGGRPRRRSSAQAQGRLSRQAGV
ncbi:uncharacterized protein DDB_G0280205-like isoform X2 [Rissa tridactyla]|uniref:uncharacterized protein DDB_G0280205-like isoform X2 n=1 Tax=Rissa tridactyla TaxID=75485 RepID=UPI0023BA587C|nr:uncharacterized protein DDB_G0280205-like isoform X2 [Rissa tridactyla]